MHKLAILTLIIFSTIAIAGCTQTGQIIKDAHLDIEQTENISNISEPVTTTGQTDNQTQNTTNTTTNRTENITNLCANVSCSPSQTTCPDGFVATCSNTCNPITGQCSACQPGCVGHEQPACNQTCGTCQQLDNSTCSCQAIQPCCGNSVCESAESYASCSADCPQPAAQIYISEIMYNPTYNENYNEWIEIYNPGQTPADLTGWTLCGKALLPGYVRYPDQAVLNEAGLNLPAGGRALITDGGTGTEVYANFNITSSLALHTETASLCGGLTNSNKTITIKDNSNNTVDSLTYFSAWGANGNGKSLTKAGNQWVEAEPSPGS